MSPPNSAIVSLEARIVPLEATVAALDGGAELVEGELTTLRLSADVLFEFDSAEVTGPARRYLIEVIAPIIEEHAVGPVKVDGHTDSKGPEDYNRGLSRDRTETVAALLRERLRDTTFDTRALGESRPIAPNTTERGEDNPAGRARNRRVEITFDASGDVPVPRGIEAVDR